VPFYDAGDAAIYYEISGKGRPLILLHGYALNSKMWALQKPIFEQNYQLVLIDLRGFGQSSCGDRWSGDVLAGDVAGIIVGLDLHSAAILGFSMGGPIAYRIALQMPERISSLMFASSILPSSGKEQKANQIKSYKREIEILTGEGLEGWIAKTNLRTGPLVENLFKLKPGLIDFWNEILANNNPDYLKAMLNARGQVSSKTNWRERMAEIVQPTLIIAGALDSRFLDAADYLHRNISRSKLWIIEDAGHMVNLEKPEEFNQAVIEFLGQRCWPL
jgi:3-oxoadipate enol-lactonase